MAAMLQQRLWAAEQAAVTAGDQCQPPVVHQGSCWQWQGLLQQGAVAEDRAAGDLIAQGQLPERWRVAASAWRALGDCSKRMESAGGLQ